MKFPLELNHRQSTEVEYQIIKIHRPSCGCLASMFSIALCEGGDLGNKVVGENMAKCSFEVCPSPTVKIHTVVWSVCSWWAYCFVSITCVHWILPVRIPFSVLLLLSSEAVVLCLLATIVHTKECSWLNWLWKQKSCFNHRQWQQNGGGLGGSSPPYCKV